MAVSSVPGTVSDTQKTHKVCVGWMGGWVGGWTDRRMDGQMDK